MEPLGPARLAPFSDFNRHVVLLVLSFAHFVSVAYPSQTAAIPKTVCVWHCTCMYHVNGVLFQYDQELGEAIELEYLRFMPFMNKALARLVQEEYPQYANDADDQVTNVPPPVEKLDSGTRRRQFFRGFM